MAKIRHLSHSNCRITLNLDELSLVLCAILLARATALRRQHAPQYDQLDSLFRQINPAWAILTQANTRAAEPLDIPPDSA